MLLQFRLKILLVAHVTDGAKAYLTCSDLIYSDIMITSQKITATFKNQVIQKYFIDFFTKGSERTLEAKKNIIMLMAFKGISIVVSIILVPLTINYINPTQYGIWITMSSIIAWFSFFDIGLGNGLRNKFAESKAIGYYDRVRIYISTTYAALIIIFSLVWIIFLISNFFINWSRILNAPLPMAGELSRVALILFSLICLQFVLKVINTVLTSDQKPAKPAFLDMLGQILILVIIVILSKTTQGSLLYLAATIGAIPVLILLISSLWFYRGSYKIFAPSIKYVRFEYAADLMKMGLKFFLIQISVIVIFQTSNIIIAQTCGPESVSIYNIAYKYFNIIYFLFCILILPFWSAFTDAYAKSDFTWMKNALKKLEVAALISVIMILILLVFSPLAFQLWIGDIIRIKFSISLMISIFFITNIYHSLYTQILNGLGKIRLQLYIIVFGAVINIPAAIFLGKKFGIEGVIASTIIINILVLLYAPLQVHLLLNKQAKGILAK